MKPFKKLLLERETLNAMHLTEAVGGGTGFTAPAGCTASTNTRPQWTCGLGDTNITNCTGA